jgi:hypothetical protein
MTTLAIHGVRGVQEFTTESSTLLGREEVSLKERKLYNGWSA